MEALKSASVQFRYLSCGECDILFYIPEPKYDRCITKGENFYCPNGHSRVFRETEIDRLKKELETEKRRVQWAQESRDYAQKARAKAEHSRNAMKGHLTRIKTRVKHGVCPCCKRTFANVSRHMSHMHPTFGGDDAG